MITSGGFKVDDEIDDWQVFPKGEGYAKPHQAAQVVFLELSRAMQAMDKAASGIGRIYVHYA